MGSEMDTFAARLASFDIVLKPEKRRSSTTKGAKTIKWPHQSPSPAELAHAGFYYKPYESNPDNTTCFQCSRALDGWEEEDNPVTEHLKHSPDCAWAIIMDIQQRSSNPATIEDPTSTRIAQARLDTFGTAWPHDGRRGWVCQSEKMVDSGWYFCPTDESNDLASCAYCKLSLDGWEPKDDPFDEHHRRSPDCSFFVFAQPSGKKGKGAKSKKPRTSKASSRLSTQSVATTTSGAPEMDVDESMDQSVLSQATVKPKASKKGPKGKGKGTKSKKEKVESEDQMDVDNPELEQPEPELEPEPEPEPEPAKSKRAGKGKKRVSDEMTNDEPEPPTQGEPEPERSAEPPAKRRATRTRSSSVSQTYNYEQADHAMPDAPTEDEAPRKGAKRGRKPKKGTSTKNRKASDVSVSSQTTSRAQLPRDSELDASIKAGLESDVPQPVEPEPEPEQPRAAKKSKNSKKSKAFEKPESPLDDPVKDDDREEPAEHQSVEPNDVDMEEPEEPVPKAKATKSSKKKGTKKTKKEEVAKTDDSAKEEDSETQYVANDPVDHESHESHVSVEVVNRQSEPRNEPEADPEDKPATKKSSKDEKAKKPKKTKKKEPSPPREPSPPPKEPSPPPKEPSPAPEPAMEEHDTQPQSADEDEFGTPEDMPDQVEMVEPPKMDSPIPEQIQEKTPRPPKTAKRYSDIPQEEHLAESLTESHRSSDRHEPGSTSRSSNRAVSPLPAAGQHTPSLSPQSSDAENRPPSRPSASRPTVSSPSKDQKARTPVAASTPSPSKRNFNGGFAASTHPWTPIDIEAALLGDADDKENADLTALFTGAKNGLSSPEKKMTVEEWVMWNAKNGEERLKRECERLVGQFEKEGGRAMRRIEAIECID